ncbi:ABC transporter permease [Oceanicella sp. SM1341]|uniref:ABC transporter permease n=1 Tax=Oceanicella sp. SM1341 TaxID=1548889 RepID=UPI0018E504DC|nr:ABC transporter permease [Oceanicella sp. SM1341]
MGPAARLLAGLALRLATALPAVFCLLALTFVLMRLLPGDPVSLMASNPGGDAAERAALAARLGLDAPLAEQFGGWLAALARGDLGRSVVTGQPVAADLAARLPASLELTLCGFGLALAAALPCGLWAARHPGSAGDHALRLLGACGAALPGFVSGLMLVLVFYHGLGWAPDPTGRFDLFAGPPPRVTGFALIDTLLAGDTAAFRDAAARLVLPSLTLALFVFAPLMRVTRGALLAVFASDYMLNARALGLTRRQRLLTWGLGNAAVPVLMVSATLFGALLGASVLVETVFTWPGVGRYAVEALQAGDYAAVQGFVLLMAGLFVLITLVADLAALALDARMLPA